MPSGWFEENPCPAISNGSVILDRFFVFLVMTVSVWNYVLNDK